MWKKADEKAQKDNDIIMRHVIIEIAARFQEQTKMAQDGEFRIDRSNTIIESIKLIQAAKKQILSTSFVSALEWWKSEDGRAYRDANYAAVAHGNVVIERVFIFKDDEQKREAAEIMRDQVNHGIRVCFVYRGDLGGWFRGDLLVVDDIVAGELTISPLNQEPGEAVMSTKLSFINDKRDKYMKVARQASVYSVSPGDSVTNCGMS